MNRTAPHMPLTGRDNQTIRYLASLSDPKVRRQEKAYLVEGVKIVEEALQNGLGVRQVIATPALTQHHGKGIIRLAEKNGLEIVWVSERLMDRISENKTPQPAIAVVALREHAVDELFSRSAKLIVIAHRLQDPGNLGTIIRTAEAAGASGVAVTQNTVDPYNAKAVRASMGSILRVPIVRVAHVSGFLKTCKGNGFQTVALTLRGERTHFDLDLTVPTAIMLGQESAGLTNEDLEGFDHRVRIPLADTIDSLNVGVSAAVVLYEAMRQRGAVSAERTSS